MNGISKFELRDGTNELVEFALEWSQSSWVKQRELEWHAPTQGGPEYKKPQIVFYSNDYCTFDPAGQIIADYGDRLRKLVSDMVGAEMILAASNLWYYMSPNQHKESQIYSQKWHRDAPVGNSLPIKLFLWCHSIKSEHGPLQYIANSRPGEKYWHLGDMGDTRTCYPSEESINETVAKGDIVTCTTDGVELFIAETIGLHRGGNIQEGYSRLCGTWNFYQDNGRMGRQYLCNHGTYTMPIGQHR